MLALVLARPARLLGQQSAFASATLASNLNTDLFPNAPSASSSSAAPAAAVSPFFVPVTSVSKTQPRFSETHRFWDRKNVVLFSLVGASAAADFCATHANLASGGKELNPLTRIFAGSTPALATNFALEATGVMAISYMFHKTGHHRMERLTTVANIGSSSFAAAYSFSHR